MSNKCFNGVCARGDGAEGSICYNANTEDQCDYGLYCASSPSSMTLSCQKKLVDDVPCTSNTACMNGACTNGTCSGSDAYKICAVVNNAYPMTSISDDYVKNVVSVASDMMYERTGKRFTIQLPIARENTPIVSSDQFVTVPIYQQWITNDCFYNRSSNPPNGTLVYAGDPFLFMTNYNGFTIVTDDLSSQGYRSSYPNSHFGAARIVGGVLKQVSVKDDAVSIFHEIMHQYDGDGANAHWDMPICSEVLGSRFPEFAMLGLSYSAIGWGSICPYTFHNFIYIERQINTQSTQKFIGKQCATDAECMSGLCASPTGSRVSSINGPYKMCMPTQLQVGQFCLADEECQSGVCLALRCQTSRPQGNNLSDHSICMSDNQCQSGLCLGSLCFTRLEGGQRCLATDQCRSQTCDVFLCGATNLSSGQSCTFTAQCQSGLVCANRQCFPGNFSEGRGCVDTVQCQQGLQCYDGQCTLSANIPPAGSIGTPCTNSNQCNSNLCAGGYCQNPCGQNNQCPIKERCGQVNGINACLQLNLPGGQRCWQNYQCQSGNCLNYRC